MFPVTQNYVTRPQDKHKFFGGLKGFSGLHTFQYVAAGQRRFFLITQCKPYSSEGVTSDWQEATVQLNDYLSAVHRTRPAGQRPRVYGIAAVGRRVRFYEYLDTTQDVGRWRPGTTWSASHNGREFYDMRTEAALVQCPELHSEQPLGRGGRPEHQFKNVIIATQFSSRENFSFEKLVYGIHGHFRPFRASPGRSL
jgi:hypothetical protein